MKPGQNGCSWTNERSLMFGGNSQSLLPSSSTPSSSSSSSSSSQVTSIDGVSFSEGDLLLQALNGFVLVVTAEGYVFYASPTIQDFLGFQQSDVVHQSVFELIHTDDRALFRRQLHFALSPKYNQQDEASESSSEQNSAEISSNVVTYDPQSIPPENSSFLERNFCCRFRCLLDNSSGFLALNFRGRLKLVHGQNRVSEDGSLVPPQLALFTIATPMQPPSILEIRNKTLLFQTKHKLDFTPMGIDSRGVVVLGYNEVEICLKGSGYNFIHAADMMYCADNHMKMMKTGESGFTVFRLLTKAGSWLWVQANARLVYKGGRPDFVVARQKALTNEEGEEQLRLRQLQLPFNFATGEAVLYDVMPSPPVAPPPDALEPCSTAKQQRLDSYGVSPNSLLGCMLRQDQSLYCEHGGGGGVGGGGSLSSLNDVAFSDSHATVSVRGDIWLEGAQKAPCGSLVKPDPTLQDMMDTLQQILGEDELGPALDVEPDELKSWESTLLKMSSSSVEMSDELNDILSNDILTYVEEQLHREAGLKLPEPAGHGQACISALELQGRSFGWIPPEPQRLPNGQAGSSKLSHMELNGALAFSPDTCTPFTQSPANHVIPGGVAPPLHNHLHTSGFNQLQDQSLQSSQWSSSGSNQVNGFGKTFTQNISTQPSSSCLQGHFSLHTHAHDTHNGDGQRHKWQQQQQQQQIQQPQQLQLKHLQQHLQQPQQLQLQHAATGGLQLPAFQRSPLTLPSDSAMFRTPETPNGAFPDGQEAPPTSCMFSGGGGGVVGSPAPSLSPAKPACFYQSLGPGRALIPDQLSSLEADGLLLKQPYLSFSEQTQVDSRPVDRNGGFSFSSLPNGNT